LFFSDTVSFADLRGRFLLDHSYFISPSSLLYPDDSPSSLLERAAKIAAFHNAA